MSDLKFDTGLVTYNINGNCEVSFNPTDSNFSKRFFDAFEELKKRQDSYTKEIEEVTDNAEVFRVANKMDQEMRSIIDGLFGVPVCEKLFGDMNVYAMANGLPVWANLIMAVLEELQQASADQMKLTDPRLRKYSAKYHVDK